MSSYLQIINQLFEIEQKIKQGGDEERFERNFNRLNNILEEEGYTFINPIGERYSDTRTDCEVNIVGKEGKEMYITQVIKPVIYKKDISGIKLVQKGIVIAQKK